MIQKTITALLVVVAFSSCSKKESTKNLQITGNIDGFKKGTLYIQKIKDTSLVTLDTIKIDGDSHFTTEFDITSPEMLYLIIDRGVTTSIDNSIPFFAEPGKINITSSLQFFNSDSKITGSKNQELYEEYKYVVSRYVDQDLDLVKAKYEALQSKNDVIIAKITEKQDAILKRKYLYTTNFAVNHSDYEIAPYLAVAEIYDINLKYLDTINKSMTPSVSKSLYGKQLKNLIAERKKNEK